MALPILGDLKPWELKAFRELLETSNKESREKAQRYHEEMHRRRLQPQTWPLASGEQTLTNEMLDEIMQQARRDGVGVGPPKGPWAKQSPVAKPLKRVVKAWRTMSASKGDETEGLNTVLVKALRDLDEWMKKRGE